jgi:lactate permease
MPWLQNYDPFQNAALSTAVAALPVVGLLGLLAFGHVRAWLAALIGLSLALGVALFAFRMPATAAFGAAGYGAAYGLFPIGWIVLNVMFLHHLTVKSGRLDTLRTQLAGVAPDPRVQVILIAFCFGAFIEGAAGFGAPVAITAALLIQLGFSPLHASGLSLIANTAPVAFGSIGIPITTLAQVTGLDVLKLSAMAGRQLPVFSALIPFWIVCAMGGWRAALGVWPVAVAAGLVFAAAQFLVSNLHGPWLVDSLAALASIAAVLTVLRFWQPKPAVGGTAHHPTAPAALPASARKAPALHAWVPWLVLTAFIFTWGVKPVKDRLDRISAPAFATPGLHLQVQRTPPVATEAKPEKAEFKLNWLSATGTGILLAGITAGLLMGFSLGELLQAWWETLVKLRWSLLTIAAMLALGNVTKFSGADATLGLALARTGSWYPFCGTLLGWLGVALTGSDTASNVLFGSLQRITSERLGLSPYLMASANSCGGVMGKMIDAQSIVVAGVATNYHRQEGKILRFVFLHSLVLAALMGGWVALQAYWPPLAATVVK